MVKILSGDIYQIEAYKKAIVSDFLLHNNDLGLEIIDLEERNDWGKKDLINLLSSTSLFCSKKLIIIKNLSKRADFTSDIEFIIDNIVNSVALVIIEPSLDNKTNFGRFLKKQSGFEYFTPYKGTKLRNWVCKKASTYNFKLDTKLADYLIQRAGEEMIVLDKELQKLRVYPSVDEKLIDELVDSVFSSSIFELVDCMIQGKLDKALILYADQRQQKNEPLSILGIFVWQLQILLIAKTNKKTIEQTAKDFGIHAFPLQKATALVRNLSFNYLNNLIALCLQIDTKIRQDFINQDEALLYLITKITYLKKA